MSSPLRVALFGAGWAGAQRATAIARHPRTTLAYVADADERAAQALAAPFDAPYGDDWRVALAEEAFDVVVVSMPPATLAEASVAALEMGCHVLVEPMGQNLDEGMAIARAATAADRVLKVGFQHRYYPALTRAYAYFSEGVIGDVIHIRARYGHGLRTGNSSAWREGRGQAGAGPLMDHGVHVFDLIHWFLGPPNELFALLQTAVWPVKPLEDSAFAMLRFEGGAVAQVHTSWTQWSDLFSFEVIGTQGALTVDGLGDGYGPHRLIVARRRVDGAAPYMETTTFDDTDISWDAEWAEFVGAVADGLPYMGSSQDGVLAMSVVDGLYQSAKTNAVVVPEWPF